MRKLLAPAMMGIIAGIDNLGAGVAFAALMFPGAMAGGLGMGVGVILLGGALLSLLIALRSQQPNSIALVQETSIAILAAAIAGITLSMTDRSEETRLATAFAILGTSTIATGGLFWLFGRLRLGTLVRFLPYPVVAGFLAGSGWLLIDGGLMMVTGEQGLGAMVTRLAEPLILGKLLPSFLFAGLMMLALRRSTNPMTTSLVLIGAGGLFYLAISISGISTDQARAWQWLPDMPAGGGGIALPSPLWIVTAADWSAVMLAGPAILSAALLSMMGLLLNTSGLEVAIGREIDANAELRSSGVANLAAGCIGGASGFTGLGITLLAERMGAKGRGAGIATAIVLLLGMIWAPQLAASMPTFLAAGLMIFLGVELLHDWAVRSRRQLPLAEWLIVLAILATIMATGFLAGLAVGLGVSVITFVYNYARLPVIRRSASGREIRSSVDRSATALHRLDSQGHLIQVVELQGYLFFGTVEQVVGCVRARLHGAGQPPLRFLLLDFRSVSGVDSAGSSGFVKICNMAATEGVQVIFCHLPPSVQDLFCRAGVAFNTGADCCTSPDLDHALERCEEQILAEDAEFHETGDVLRHLEAILGPHPRLPDIVSGMERLILPAGERLIQAGDAADDIFLVGDGRVKVQVTLPNGRVLRLRTMTAGAIVGEITLYLGGSRTADVIVEQQATLFRLGRADLRRMEQQDSDLALLVHRLLATTLAERLALANRLLQRSQN
ncbi:SulP family inorganic anion transporter [Niveispirillum irakense]|uniref:SulP family inorganic anion transporter n=1 Tax=Niveispirillum irakense TaxID=34011 RepID=UPI00041D98A7|nr:SulP family inorganic anion transporter [Niveispirillum irakense]